MQLLKGAYGNQVHINCIGQGCTIVDLWISKWFKEMTMICGLGSLHV